MTATAGFIVSQRQRFASLISRNRSRLGDVTAVAGSRLARQGALIVSMAAGARVLDKEDLGIWSLINIVVQFSVLLSDAGISTFVVREKELSDKVYGTAYYCCVALSLLITLASIALVMPLVYTLGYAESYLYFLVAAASILPLGVSGVIQAYLRRQHKFALIFTVDVVVNVLLIASVVLMLHQGCGLWSLVAPTLVTACLGCLVFVVATPIPTFGFDRSVLKQIIDYSSGLVGFSTINYWARNADHVLIGRFIGAEALGVYSIAYRIMMLPMSQINSIALTVALPYMSPHQDDHRTLRVTLRRMLVIIGAITTGPIALVWLYRYQTIDFVLGTGWSEVGDLLTALLPLAMFQTLASPVGICFQITGRTGLYFRLGVFSTVVMVSSFAAGILLGSVQALVYCYCIAMLVTSPIGIAFAMRTISSTLCDWLLWCAPFFASIATCVLAHYALATVSGGASLLTIETLLAVSTSTFASVYAVSRAWQAAAD